MPSVNFDFSNLITEVRKRPILYDKTVNGDREEAWREISDTLLLPSRFYRKINLKFHDNINFVLFIVEQCNQKWMSLRDKFAKRLIVGNTSPWPYHNQMLFMASHIDEHFEFARRRGIMPRLIRIQ